MKTLEELRRGCSDKVSLEYRILKEKQKPLLEIREVLIKNIEEDKKEINGFTETFADGSVYAYNLILDIIDEKLKDM